MKANILMLAFGCFYRVSVCLLAPQISGSDSVSAVSLSVCLMYGPTAHNFIHFEEANFSVKDVSLYNTISTRKRYRPSTEQKLTT